MIFLGFLLEVIWDLGLLGFLYNYFSFFLLKLIYSNICSPYLYVFRRYLANIMYYSIKSFIKYFLTVDLHFYSQELETPDPQVLWKINLHIDKKNIAHYLEINIEANQVLAGKNNNFLPHSGIHLWRPESIHFLISGKKLMFFFIFFLINNN